MTDARLSLPELCRDTALRGRDILLLKINREHFNSDYIVFRRLGYVYPIT